VILGIGRNGIGSRIRCTRRYARVLHYACISLQEVKDLAVDAVSVHDGVSIA